MSSTPVLGHVHSIQTLGTLDGPGVRFVIFTQGCPLRCACCHNPDTWKTEGGTTLDPDELTRRALRYREYFGQRGGVTLSGGEPLLQADFSTSLFKKCHAVGLHTCLDTSGCILDGTVKELLLHTDRVLLDIKYPSDSLYREYVGCSIDAPLAFLNYLNEHGIPTTLRQVIIPTLNDTQENLEFLASLIQEHPCIDGFELLPFKKLCSVKYERMGLPFRFADMREATQSDTSPLEEKLSQMLSGRL